MELATMSRVIVEISPTVQSKVTQKLIELGAVMRRFSSARKTAHEPNPASSEGREVVIEAMIDTAAANSVVKALSEVCSDDTSITISVSYGFSPAPWTEVRRSREALAERTEKWGDYLITR